MKMKIEGCFYFCIIHMFLHLLKFGTIDNEFKSLAKENIINDLMQNLGLGLWMISI